MRISDWSSDVCSSDLVIVWRIAIVVDIDVEIVFAHQVSVGFHIVSHFLGRFFKRKRLLRFQNRFGLPRIAAFDALDWVIRAEIVEARSAFRASPLRAPFRLHHVPPLSFSPKPKKSASWPSPRRKVTRPCHSTAALSKAGSHFSSADRKSTRLNSSH